MDRGRIYIYTGDGHGKSPAAWGRAIQAASEGKKVVIIQFLKGKSMTDSEFLRRLEPEIKLIQFEKSEAGFETLSEEKKQEEVANIRNGLNYAKKVLSVSECDLLILDEVLGLIDNGILSKDELRSLVDNRHDTDVILTGVKMDDDICCLADEISKIKTLKYKVW